MGEVLQGSGLIGQGLNTMHQANKDAKANAQEGNIAGANLEKQIHNKAANQTISLLQSGIVVDGSANDTPATVINETYKTGKEDLDRLNSNFNTKSKNIVSQARMKVIKSFSDAVTGAFTGGAGGGNQFSGSGGAEAMQSYSSYGNTGSSIDWLGEDPNYDSYGDLNSGAV